MSYGTCKKCGCTDETACYHADHGPCWWINNDHDLCSHCSEDFPDPEGVEKFGEGILLDDAITRDIGPVGTPERDKFDEQLKREIENEN